VGGEYLDETGQTLWNQYYADNVIHFVNGDLNGPAGTTPASVRLYNNADSQNGSHDERSSSPTPGDQPADAQRRRPLRPLPGVAAGAVAGGRPLRPLGARLRRGVRGDRVQPHRPAPRRHLRLTGDGRTVLKANWGRFYFNTGRQPGRLGESEHRQPVLRLHLERPERRPRLPGRREGVLETAVRRRGQRFIDPNLQNSYTDEASFFLERALLADLGLRVGYVWKKDNQGWQQINDCGRSRRSTCR
jgi:hypothetical protein